MISQRQTAHVARQLDKCGQQDKHSVPETHPTVRIWYQLGGNIVRESRLTMASFPSNALGAVPGRRFVEDAR